LTLQCVLERLP